MEKFPSSINRVFGKIPEAEKEQILRERGKRFEDQDFEDVKEKESNRIILERLLKNKPEVEKEQILQERVDNFYEQDFENWKGKEREKTLEELEIISIANQLTNEVRQKYGLENFDIPPENIHIIKQEDWLKEKENLGGFFNAITQSIFIREQPSKIMFAETVFHEMLHFKSYHALQIITGENPELVDYRSGLSVYSTDGKEAYFTNLDEAVVVEITKRFTNKLFSNSLFADEIQQTRDIIDDETQTVTITETGKSLFNEDTYYAKIQGSSKSWRDQIGLFLAKLLGKSYTYETTTTHTHASFPYEEQRKILNLLIDKILERNSDKFQNREEVFEVFAKGMMTGNILSLGKLIEKTFGVGTLRKIGELDENIKAQEEYVNSL